ncbi:MAG TPA: FIST C-terminal domain-containing protein [Elusimicrobiota bacterium]|nr:FIST C-terminal domain-containing protein [Elusimicrobiota bacterium]
MKWASAVSERPRLERAVQECAASLKEQMGGASVDFVMAFVSVYFMERCFDVNALVMDALPCNVFIGCSAAGIIGAGREVENRPGLSLMAASLPKVVVKPFALRDEDLPDLDDPPRRWEALVGVKAAENPHFVLLSDPFSVRLDNFLGGMDYAFPKAVKIGGVVSGALAPAQSALYLNSMCQRSGLVGVSFVGDLTMDPLVAQGCRPIGRPMTVTDCQENILLELEKRPPLQVLQDLVDSLDPNDQELAKHSLFLGIIMDPRKETYGKGDFLIRNIIGADMKKGILAVGTRLRKGQGVQFHLRDARAAAQELQTLLSSHGPSKDKIAGALLFSCLGRGEYLYGRRDHDSQMFQRTLGQKPLGGFFCNGEIGPVGASTYLHGYTSCFALLRPKW